MEALFKIAEQYGLQLAVIAFFIWRDWQREKELNERDRTREEFVQRSMMAALEKCSYEIASANSLRESLIIELAQRPCLQGVPLLIPRTCPTIGAQK